MKVFSILVIAITLFAIVNGLSTPLLLDQESGYSLSWEIDNDTITFQASINAATWFGLGFHCNGCQTDMDMQNVDFVVSSFAGPNQLMIWDMYSNPNPSTSMKPVNDTALNGTYNILAASGYQTSEYSIVTFSRLLNTGDNLTDHVIIPGPLDLVWAYGSSNTFQKHPDGNAGRLTVDLLSGSVTYTDPGYVNYHATFMTVAFAVLMPLGIFVGRYLKAHQWWFPLHIILQVTATLFALVGFGLAWKMMGGLQFDTLHAIFGLVTLILMLLSIILGALSHKMWDELRTKVPIFPDIIHWFGGRLTVLFGIVTIFLGLILHQVPIGVIIVFGITIGFYFVIAIFLEVYMRLYPHTSLSHEHQHLLN